MSDRVFLEINFVQTYEAYTVLSIPKTWKHDLSSFAHSARPGREVEMLGWSREGHNHRYFRSGSRISMVCKKVVAFTVVMLPCVLTQSCLISGDQVGC